MTDLSQLDKLERLSNFLIIQAFPTRIPSEAEIKDQVMIGRLAFPASDEDCERVLKRVYANMRISMEIGDAVVDVNTYRPWLNERRERISFYYWNRYRKYLETFKDWNVKVLETLNIVSDEIIDLLGNPEDVFPWQRRGLIMGDVQSGKTTNYAAICNKAMDVGYKIIIILTGTLENLRRQTQERLDAELVGLDSQMILDKIGRKITTGVGRIDSSRFVATFTSKNNDFDQSLLNNLNMRISTCAEPVVFVVKKQKQRLTHLERWLRLFNAEPDGKISSPLLVIDDEADNASVNTKSEDNPTAINERIRTLLNLFKRASYVGITATPYANIFIHPENESQMLGDDLFPRDFIYSLKAPTNYIGSNAIFGLDATHGSIVQTIRDDAEEILPIKHSNSFVLHDLPESLYDALNYFLLTNAVRDLRGEANTHRSMLVNVSRFTNVQSQVLNIISGWLISVKSSLLNFGCLEASEALKNPFISQLFATWTKFGFAQLCGQSWDYVLQTCLTKSTNPIVAVEVNQKTSSAILDYQQHYDTGLRVIAVGGNSLSRGLTLEGLCVSYFYRNSQSYDTLLQMGRWFGYRPGYEDLCKVWMTAETQECYSHITAATSDLREDICTMRHYQMTPKDFGFEIRCSPDSTERMISKLMITAPNKMKNATDYVHTVSVSNKVLETPKLPIVDKFILGNWNLAKNFISEVSHNYAAPSDDIAQSNCRMWINIPKERIASFIRGFVADPLSLSFQPDGIANFIENENNMPYWDLALPEAESGQQINITGSVSVKKQRRSIDLSPKNKQLLRVSGDKLRVGSRPCTRYGLPTTEVTRITQEEEKKDPNKSISDKAFLIRGRKPLLLLHFLDIQIADSLQKEDKISEKSRVSELVELIKCSKACLVALGVGFPLASANSNMHVKYKINIVKRNQLMEAAAEAQDDDD